MDVMAGMAANPNVYGIIVVSLGCENCQMDLVVDAIRERTNKPMETFIIQENGGTITTIERACWKKNGTGSFKTSKRRIPNI